MQEILPPEYYEHFICFVVAIRLLTQDKVSLEDIESAAELLNFYVMRYEKLYGLEHMTYKIHALLHLPYQVLFFGPLHKHSGYHFEGTAKFQFNIFNKNKFNTNKSIKNLKGFFHIMNSYIHGTRGRANQIFINHRIGSYIEGKKTKILNSIEDLEMKNLFLTITGLNSVNINSYNFTQQFVSDVEIQQHQQLLIQYGLSPDSVIEKSDFAKKTNTVYSTSSYDANKISNNHTVMYKNNKIGLIEKFIKIENKLQVIIRALKKEVVTIKNKQKILP